MNTKPSAAFPRFQFGRFFGTLRFLPLFLLLALAGSVPAQDYIYSEAGGQVTIIRYTGPGGAVSVPDTINGLPVTRIGGWAFQFTHNLEALTIPNTVTKIDDWAFGGCEKLKVVSIPESVAEIGDMAFVRGTSLLTIDVDPLNQFFSSEDGVLFNKDKTSLIQFPAGRSGSYTVPGTVTNVSNFSFQHCNGLTSVTLGNNVSSIGKDVFYFCGNLLTVVVPASVARIEDWTFLHCTNLAGVYFTGDAPTVGPFAFYRSDNVTFYYLPGASGWSDSLAQRPTAPWQPASLQVYIRGSGALLHEARWRVDGGDWHENGAVITNLVPGERSVCFSNVPGWVEPSCQPVNVTAGRGALAYGFYLPMTGATASAVLANGFVVGVNIANRGYGYTNPPAVFLVGGGGSGARASATITNGAVAAVNVGNAGFGYTSPPSVIITSPFRKPIELRLAPASWLTFSGLQPGGTYQLQASAAGQWMNVATPFEAADSDYSAYVDGIADKFSYRLVPLPEPAQAAAIPEIVNGFLVDATIVQGGVGYTAPPEIRIVDSEGAGAACVAVVDQGQLIAITILDAGSGYSLATSFEIAPPPAAIPLHSAVSKATRLDASELIPGLFSQVQWSPDLINWVQWDDPFLTESPGYTAYLKLEGAIRLFRVRQGP
jgi:hypothetical protein